MSTFNKPFNLIDAPEQKRKKYKLYYCLQVPTLNWRRIPYTCFKQENVRRLSDAVFSYKNKEFILVSIINDFGYESVWLARTKD